MSDIQAQLSSLAETFTSQILETLRGASMDDIVNLNGAGSVKLPTASKTASKTTSTGRLARRDPEEIAATIETIVAVLKKAPEGLRSEQLQEMTGIPKKEITGPIAQALASKQIKKTGNKRATTYFLGGGKVVKGPKKAASRVSKPAKAVKKATKPAKKATAKAPAKKPAAKKL